MSSMRRFPLVALLLLLAAPAWAQDDPFTSYTESFLFIPQAHPFTALSGTGLSATFDVPTSNLGAGNPAALGAFDRPSLGLSYRFETSIPGGYITEFFDYEAENGARPQAAAVVVPVGAFHLGASYVQRYAGGLAFESILGLGPTTADTVGSSISARVETFAPQAAYRFGSALAEGDEVTFGFRVGFGRVAFEDRIDTLATRFSDWGTSGTVGVSYRAATARPLGIGPLL